MSVHRSGASLIRLAAACAGPAFYALWIRPQMLAWGATPDETTRTYPGDELVPDPDGGATMATILPAPPERVWPWLVQMGGDRAGWYSWDWVDNNGEASADRIVPEWQNLEVGQRLKGPTNWWTVVVLEPDRTLVLQSSYGLLTGQSFDPRTGPLPRVYADGIWGFHLRPTPGGGTRLVIRTRSRGRPRLFARPFGLLLGEPALSVAGGTGGWLRAGIPLGALPARLGELPTGRPVVAVCQSGLRSGRAARMLARQGHEVYNLRGGMRAWAGAGLSVKASGGARHAR